MAMATNYVSKTADMTLRVPEVHEVTTGLITKARKLLKDGSLVKGKKRLEDGSLVPKVVTPAKDADGNVLLTARELWKALPVPMALARKILARLIENGDIVAESSRYAELHGE